MRHVSRFAVPLAVAFALAAALAAPVAAQAQPKQPPQKGPPPPAPAKPYTAISVKIPGPLNDPSFDAFRKQLGEAAAKKDRAALSRLMVGQGFFWDGEKGDQADKKKSAIDNLTTAMALAGNPKVLLLDEPLAGMGQEEGERMVALLKSLASAHAVLLIEHDMDFVFAVADRLTVLVEGAVLATGRPAEVRADPAVQSAYLGRQG